MPKRKWTKQDQENVNAQMRHERELGSDWYWAGTPKKDRKW
jgi:hypothetical protein